MRMKSKFVNISYVPYALDIMQLLCMRLQIEISNFIWHYTNTLEIVMRLLCGTAVRVVQLLQTDETSLSLHHHASHVYAG